MPLSDKYNYCYNDCPYRKIHFDDRYIVNDCQKSDTTETPEQCPKRGDMDEGTPFMRLDSSVQ